MNAVCPDPVRETGMMNADLATADDPEAMKQRFIAGSPLASAYDRMINAEEDARLLAVASVGRR